MAYCKYILGKLPAFPSAKLSIEEFGHLMLHEMVRHDAVFCIFDPNVKLEQ